MGPTFMIHSNGSHNTTPFDQIRMNWIVGLMIFFIFFYIKLLKLWTMDAGVKGIGLTLDLISKLAPLESFNPPLSYD